MTPLQKIKIEQKLNPHVDWRVMAEAVKSYPKCKNCGQEYGNVAFGMYHGCEKGYNPEK